MRITGIFLDTGSEEWQTEGLYGSGNSIKFCENVLESDKDKVYF